MNDFLDQAAEHHAKSIKAIVDACVSSEALTPAIRRYLEKLLEVTPDFPEQLTVLSQIEENFAAAKKNLEKLVWQLVSLILGGQSDVAEAEVEAVDEAAAETETDPKKQLFEKLIGKIEPKIKALLEREDESKAKQIEGRREFKGIVKKLYDFLVEQDSEFRRKNIQGLKPHQVERTLKGKHFKESSRETFREWINTDVIQLFEEKSEDEAFVQAALSALAETFGVDIEQLKKKD